MISNEQLRKLQQKKLFLFDIDGTLALANELIVGADRLLAYLNKTGKRIFYITNNSTRNEQDYIKYFSQWNIKVEKEELMTAGILTVRHFQENFVDKKIFIVANPTIREMFVDKGLNVVEKYEEGIDCVLVCFDTSLTYQKLTDACRILEDENVAFYATNLDLNCPVDFGAIPDCGSICMTIENATKRKPYFIGKPQPDIVLKCMEISGYSKEETVVVGDRIDTDLACAANAGVDGVLVLTGGVSRKEVQSSEVPIQYVLENVEELLKCLEAELD